jgi:hypothetical protein
VNQLASFNEEFADIGMMGADKVTVIVDIPIGIDI